MNGTRPTTPRSRFGAGHVAWLAMFLSILIWRVGEVQAGTLGNTGNWYRIALVLLAALTAAFALLRNGNRLSQALCGPVLLLLCYGVIALVSSVYIPQHSFYSLWKGFELVNDVMVIAAVMTYPAPLESVRLAYRVILACFATLIVIAWIEAAVMPASAFVPSRGLIPFTLQGVLPVINGNGLAFLSAVVAFAAWCHLLRSRSSQRRLLASPALAVSATTLVMAQSRTSVVALLVAIGIQVLFDRRFGWFAVIAAAAAAFAAFTALPDVLEQYFIRGQSRELLTSLSGRTQGWEAAWAYFLQSPIVGHGFAAAARADILGTTGASTLHGAIFDVLVGVGLLGFVPWAAAILLTTVRLLGLALRRGPGGAESARDRSVRAEMLGLLAMTLVRSTTSSGLALHEHSFMLFLVVVAFAAVSMKRSPGSRSVAVAQTLPVIDRNASRAAR